MQEIFEGKVVCDPLWHCIIGEIVDPYRDDDYGGGGGGGGDVQLETFIWD